MARRKGVGHVLWINFQHVTASYRCSVQGFHSKEGNMHLQYKVLLCSSETSVGLSFRSMHPGLSPALPALSFQCLPIHLDFPDGRKEERQCRQRVRDDNILLITKNVTVFYYIFS